KSNGKDYDIKGLEFRNRVRGNKFETTLTNDLGSLTQSFRKSVLSSFVSGTQISEIVVSANASNLLDAKYLNPVLDSASVVTATPVSPAGNSNKNDQQPAEHKQEATQGQQEELAKAQETARPQAEKAAAEKAAAEKAAAEKAA